MLGSWIHEVVSIPVHVHPPDTIGNETRNLFPLNSSMAALAGPGEAYSCVPYSQQRYTTGTSVPKAHIDDGPFNSSEADIS
ncbi:hypothetical protein AVEN_95425-1 [Araneus ventricosus]|uniref:Uncharacterized protein n=1 Tax=Araneus ventricosus TaxID=182803 RepID=A0A4Y2CJS6_ARAVE|nr:hypothetical protein AVEN_95425-1 [Araneus ventricosus]